MRDLTHKPKTGSPALLRRPTQRPDPEEAFTLLELLTVISIMLCLLSLTLPAFHTIQAANQFSANTTKIADILDQARAAAMALNTFVYVGFLETDQDPSPNVPQTANGTGKLKVIVAASVDGTRRYDVYHPELSWNSIYTANNGFHLRLLNQPQTIENIHMTATLGPMPEAGPMSKKAGRQTVTHYYRLGSPTCKSVTPISYPLGTPLDPVNCTCYFEKIIQFDPNGVARIQYATNGDEIKQCIEIGLEPTHGNRVNSPVDEQDKHGNYCAIQLDPITGCIRIYKP